MDERRLESGSVPKGRAALKNERREALGRAAPGLWLEGLEGRSCCEWARGGWAVWACGV